MHACILMNAAIVTLWFVRLLQTEEKFARDWIDSHTSAAAALKKPLLLSEFGKTEPRDKYFSNVFNVRISAFIHQVCLSKPEFLSLGPQLTHMCTAARHRSFYVHEHVPPAAVILA